jgi:hypothetical protein
MAIEYDGGGGCLRLAREVSVGDDQPRASWSVEALRALRALATCRHELDRTNLIGGGTLWCACCGAIQLKGGEWCRPPGVSALVSAYMGPLGNGGKRGEKKG